MTERDSEKDNYKISISVETKVSPLENLSEIERKLVHKFDWRLMPMLATIYFFSSLDRSNIGNASVAGMNADIGISSTQFSNVASVLYATYLPVMLPGVWLMKLCPKPKYYLAGMVFCWSVCSLCTMFATGYGSLMAIRLLLGLFEGSFFSCMSIIATDYYFPDELGRRTAYFFASSSLASAFGGLIATGITKISSGSLKPWQYIFLIEGILSLLASIWLFLGLPDNPTGLIKTEEEKQAYEDRERRRVFFMDSSSFQWSEVLEAFADYKTHLSYVIQFTQDVCLYGFSTFLPSILKSGLGYDALEAQYLGVPVYLFAGIVFLVAAELSDRTRMRGPFIAFTNIFGIAGYILLLAVKNDGVKYFACYLVAFSIYTGTGINESWIASNTAPRYKRYTSIGLNQTLGNVSGAISPQVYRSPPNYTLGHAFTLGCLVISSICSMTSSILFYRRNKQNQRVIETGIDDRGRRRTIGDDSPEFQFLL